jgi:phosphoribosyl-AMP cyclohydrolase
MTGYRTLRKELVFNEQGLIPAVIQDRKTKWVLTLCYLNDLALKKTLETGTVYLYRRSQKRLMQKGQTSGHIQVIREVAVDCEGKSLLFVVDQRVAACHAGYFTCYFRRLTPRGTFRTVGRRIFDPKRVY